MPPRDVLAAGAVVYRSGKQVLLVHRPKYDDWSFPKGKLDPGEHVTAAAVREVEEETGLHVRLGPPLEPQRYLVAGGRTKHVSYWVGRVLGDHDVSGYRLNDEIDGVRWVPYDEALELLTYGYDRATLRASRPLRRPTRPVVVLRHASARSRRGWGKDDRKRPLLQSGSLQAERLVPVLAAYGVSRVLTSGSRRCLDTVRPFADTTGWPLEVEDGLSEEGASPASVRRAVTALVGSGDAAVVCTHRPVLPGVLAALGVPDDRLEPGAFLVAHLRHGEVVATERHWLH
ncbi:NUDIX hydrolase [Nocardioides sp. KIGAM211]|uniref:NUDIX hydrolase n=1 Tax=Nocardioides luti TaxID=2761101 RepID=A0A7X0VB42_9ACTN|nr:NUDIX domain-containing protein [Nocardioides luti]MBB6628454.1 NUDIX hydrolase [Nocardioides luti]